MNAPLKVGIAGLGRSGWDIHAHLISQLPEKYRVVGALDFSTERLKEAQNRFNCNIYTSFQELCADTEVEAIIVATPNAAHCSNVIEALQAGKHVVCEKPFGVTLDEADAMIAAAQEAEKFISPFQNRRYEEHFQKVREILDSGVLGEINLIHINWHNFGRRWDWQTLREFGGGQLSNTGPHIFDHALQLLGGDDDEIPEVWGDVRNVLSSGDAEDHIKVGLRLPDGTGPFVDVEISAATAYPAPRWAINGKNGGLRGDLKELEWKWVDWSQMPERPIDKEPTQDRSYNWETLEWQSDNWSGPFNTDAWGLRFYNEFYAAVREGAPLAITPQSVRRQIAVIEKCRRLAAVETE